MMFLFFFLDVMDDSILGAVEGPELVPSDV